MNIHDLTEHTIGILGFGQEGQAIQKYLQKHNLEAMIFDESSGPNYLDKLSDCSVIFRSPGVWRFHPEILAAEQKGSIITSQAKWFFDNCPSKIIGVTGTKGKGTTSSLIQTTLQTAGIKSFLTGNIGKIQPLEILDELKGPEWIVYELSSFQLQDLTVSPHIGICLMVTSDHLNHHSNLSEYHSAKAAITAFQNEGDISIYNADYDATATIGQLSIGDKLAISARLEPSNGAFIHDNSITIKLKNGMSTVINCESRKLRGVHNLENIAAGALASFSVGINEDIISTTVNDFAGLEHRLQFVGAFKDVSYYNDSISTVPETAIAAIRSFEQPIHLLLGGSDKGLDYHSLAEEVLAQGDHISSIILLGEIGQQIKTDLQKVGVKVQIYGPYHDFELAVKETIGRANSGDVVLLSPASASFDMFNNYADRGNQFIKLVKEFNQ